VNSNVVPNDVKQDIFKIRVAVVTVGAPAANAQVNFHVTGTRRGVADLNDRAAKIRPAFDADKTGMQNANGFSIGGLEPVTLQPLVAPDGLEQAFRRRIIFVAQDIPRTKARAPVGVKIFRRRKHCGLLLRRWHGKVKPTGVILNAPNGRFARLTDRVLFGVEFLLAGIPNFLLDFSQRFDERPCHDCGDEFDETLRRSHGRGGHLVYGRAW
jgi:hypothetical protein